MAKKKSSKARTTSRAPKPGKTRYRRSDDELLDDLRKRIEEVKARSAARALKEQSGAVKEAIKCARSLQKANEMASEEGNTALQHTLADAHQALSAFFSAEGLKMPKARRPRGRRPKVGAAE